MFELYLERSAAKSLKALSRNIFKRIIPKIQSLKENLKQFGCRKIAGSENDYRVMVGDYRIIYEIDEVHNPINIMAVGHRKDVYRG